MNKLILKMFVLCFSLILISPVSAFALGVSPAGVKLVTMIPGKTKAIDVTVSRIRSDKISYLYTEVKGEISKFVTVKNGNGLNFPVGVKSMPVTINVDGASFKDGEKYSGNILFREQPERDASSAMVNFPGVMFSVNIEVSDDDSTLLKIDSVGFSWARDIRSIRYSFMQRNERYIPAHVQKVKFIFAPVDDTGTKIIREADITADDIEAGKERQQLGEISVDDPALVGDFNVSAEFFDEKGRSVFTSTPTEMSLNSDQAAINKKRSRYIMFIVASLSIAALFMGDFLFIRKRRKHHTD